MPTAGVRTVRATRRARRGFTLVEMIVALAIGAVAAGATALSLSNMARSRDGARARSESFDRAQRAADRIATDVLGVVRDHDPYFTRLQIVNGERNGAPSDELLLLTTLSRPTPVALLQAEADFAEVQYRLVHEGDAMSGSQSESEKEPVLWRRVDSTPDDVQEGGGIATPFVPGVVALSIEAGDAQSWYDEWDSDFDGLPHLIRITVTARDDRERSTRTYRRTVAIDRVPLTGGSVVDAEESTEEAAPAGTGGEGGTGGTTPATGTGGGGGGTGGGRTGGGGGGGGGQGGGGRPGGGGGGAGQGGGGGGVPGTGGGGGGGVGGGGGGGGAPRGGQGGGGAGGPR